MHAKAKDEFWLAMSEFSEDCALASKHFNQV
jgi:hypothetical protein